MTDQKAITATTTGRVQGVGYRYSVVHVANELGLVGWVQNTPDGSVKTWAQGH
jgi:acylphosphatase